MTCSCHVLKLLLIYSFKILIVFLIEKWGKFNVNLLWEKFSSPATEHFHVPIDPTLESIFFLRQIHFCVSIWFATALEFHSQHRISLMNMII